MAASSTRRTTSSLRPPRIPRVRRTVPSARGMRATLASGRARRHQSVAFVSGVALTSLVEGNSPLPSERRLDVLAKHRGVLLRGRVSGQLLPAPDPRVVGAALPDAGCQTPVSGAVAARRE